MWLRRTEIICWCWRLRRRFIKLSSILNWKMKGLTRWRGTWIRLWRYILIGLKWKRRFIKKQHDYWYRLYLKDVGIYNLYIKSYNQEKCIFSFKCKFVMIVRLEIWISGTTKDSHNCVIWNLIKGHFKSWFIIQDKRRKSLDKKNGCVKSIPP